MVDLVNNIHYRNYHGFITMVVFYLIFRGYCDIDLGNIVHDDIIVCMRIYLMCFLFDCNIFDLIIRCNGLGNLCLHHALNINKLISYSIQSFETIMEVPYLFFYQQLMPYVKSNNLQLIFSVLQMVFLLHINLLQYYFMHIFFIYLTMMLNILTYNLLIFHNFYSYNLFMLLNNSLSLCRLFYFFFLFLLLFQYYYYYQYQDCLSLLFSNFRIHQILTYIMLDFIISYLV